METENELIKLLGKTMRDLSSAENKNGELRGAVNILLLNPEMIKDEDVRTELAEIANG